MADVAREQDPLALVITEGDPTVATIITITIIIILLGKAETTRRGRVSIKGKHPSSFILDLAFRPMSYFFPLSFFFSFSVFPVRVEMTGQKKQPTWSEAGGTSGLVCAGRQVTTNFQADEQGRERQCRLAVAHNAEQFSLQLPSSSSG